MVNDTKITPNFLLYFLRKTVDKQQDMWYNTNIEKRYTQSSPRKEAKRAGSYFKQTEGSGGCIAFLTETLSAETDGDRQQEQIDARFY